MDSQFETFVRDAIRDAFDDGAHYAKIFEDPTVLRTLRDNTTDIRVQLLVGKFRLQLEATQRRTDAEHGPPLSKNQLIDQGGETTTPRPAVSETRVPRESLD